MSKRSLAESRRSLPPAFLRFHDLCTYRVSQILLIASDYDAYVIAEDGQLGAHLFLNYSEFYQDSSPRFAHAESPESGLRLLRERRIDLILTTFGADTPEGRHFLTQVQQLYPRLPVVLLVIDELNWRKQLDEVLPPGLFGAFLWTGDYRLVSAIVRLVEDFFNIDEDTKNVGVQVILTVEDSISSYSMLLTYLYEELMRQSRSLTAEGVNLGNRMLRMLTRPKILLARSYERAIELFEHYRPYIFALITDVQFREREDSGGCPKRSGRRFGNAKPNELTYDEPGFRLADYCLKNHPDLPVLMHSAEPGFQSLAESRGYHYFLKNSEQMHTAIDGFLSESLGFGDFVFRLPDRSEVARARDTYEFERLLHSVDSTSLYYHASNNHFNVWLRARSLFDLANEIRDIDADSFASREEMRQYLISRLHAYTQQEQAGMISELPATRLASDEPFVKIGGGSMGGKGRGIAFLHSRLEQYRDFVRDTDLEIAVPRTVVLGTEVFDSFLQHNELEVAQLLELSDEAIWDRLRNCNMPPEIVPDLQAALNFWHGPMIVRSSSLLEDSQHQPCAGIYHTSLVPCNSGSPILDWRELCAAILKVYMSTFASRARNYLGNTLFPCEEEKMAVVIQELVGREHGDLYYPDCAGVGVSYNYYPLEPQLKEDGLVAMCLGLGHGVVEGGSCVHFSPKWPRVLPHLHDSARALRYSQRQFYALNMARGDTAPDHLSLFPLERAEADGTLAPLASVLTANGCWRDGLMYAGPRVVTFSDLLRDSDLRIGAVLSALLQSLHKSLGGIAELEFALKLGEHPTLYLLQLRPVVSGNLALESWKSDIAAKDVICASSSVLGHGNFAQIYDIVFVRRDELSIQEARLAAAEVARLNAELRAADRPYVLIGPGRWGSADPSLGIPVDISQILGAKVIVELPYGDKLVEPSQGSHFFHELMALNIGYLTLFEGYYCQDSDHKHGHVGNLVDSGYLNLAWLKSQAERQRGELVSLISVDKPLIVQLDGREEQAVIAVSAAK